MYSSKGWNAASVPTLSVLLIWTLEAYTKSAGLHSKIHVNYTTSASMITFISNSFPSDYECVFQRIRHGSKRQWVSRSEKPFSTVVTINCVVICWKLKSFQRKVFFHNQGKVAHAIWRETNAVTALSTYIRTTDSLCYVRRCIVKLQNPLVWWMTGLPW